MNTQRRTVQLAIPQSDYALLRHLSHDNGWTIIDQDTEDSEAERYLHAEEMARKIAFVLGHFQLAVFLKLSDGLLLCLTLRLPSLSNLHFLCYDIEEP